MGEPLCRSQKRSVKPPLQLQMPACVLITGARGTKVRGQQLSLQKLCINLRQTLFSALTPFVVLSLEFVFSWEMHGGLFIASKLFSRTDDTMQERIKRDKSITKTILDVVIHSREAYVINLALQTWPATWCTNMSTSSVNGKTSLSIFLFCLSGKVSVSLFVPVACLAF